MKQLQAELAARDAELGRAKQQVSELQGRVMALNALKAMESASTSRPALMADDSTAATAAAAAAAEASVSLQAASRRAEEAERRVSELQDRVSELERLRDEASQKAGLLQV